MVVETLFHHLGVLQEAFKRWRLHSVGKMLPASQMDYKFFFSGTVSLCPKSQSYLGMPLGFPIVSNTGNSAVF